MNSICSSLWRMSRILPLSPLVAWMVTSTMSGWGHPTKVIETHIDFNLLALMQTFKQHLLAGRLWGKLTCLVHPSSCSKDRHGQWQQRTLHSCLITPLSLSSYRCTQGPLRIHKTESVDPAVTEPSKIGMTTLNEITYMTRVSVRWNKGCCKTDHVNESISKPANTTHSQNRKLGFHAPRKSAYLNNKSTRIDVDSIRNLHDKLPFSCARALFPVS